MHININISILFLKKVFLKKGNQVFWEFVESETLQT